MSNKDVQNYIHTLSVAPGLRAEISNNAWLFDKSIVLAGAGTTHILTPGLTLDIQTSGQSVVTAPNRMKPALIWGLIGAVIGLLVLFIVGFFLLGFLGFVLGAMSAKSEVKDTRRVVLSFQAENWSYVLPLNSKRELEAHQFKSILWNVVNALPKN